VLALGVVNYSSFRHWRLELSSGDEMRINMPERAVIVLRYGSRDQE
jgi:hypothetical protein